MEHLLNIITILSLQHKSKMLCSAKLLKCSAHATLLTCFKMQCTSHTFSMSFYNPVHKSHFQHAILNLPQVKLRVASGYCIG